MKTNKKALHIAIKDMVKEGIVVGPIHLAKYRKEFITSLNKNLDLHKVNKKDSIKNIKRRSHLVKTDKEPFNTKEK
jgi:hypothetical protein